MIHKILIACAGLAAIAGAALASSAAASIAVATRSLEILGDRTASALEAIGAAIVAIIAYVAGNQALPRDARDDWAVVSSDDPSPVRSFQARLFETVDQRHYHQFGSARIGA